VRTNTSIGSLCRVEGKTYSLFGSEASTADYYRTISALADVALERNPNIHALIGILDRASKKKRFLKKQIQGTVPFGDQLVQYIVTMLREVLAPYTVAVKAHLKELSILKRWDRTLCTSEEQYHLYMLLIELTNRAWRDLFRTGKRRIALLPYCLRDLFANCRSGPGEFDYICKGCSKDCFVNSVSTLLRDTGIEPYLWMSANLRQLLLKLKTEEESIAVMGVACAPELLQGMRLCVGLNIPVVGIPLNANRCIRWMGAFHSTSVDLDALFNLIHNP